MLVIEDIKFIETKFSAEQEIEDLRERGQALKPKMRKLNEDIERIKSIK